MLGGKKYAYLFDDFSYQLVKRWKVGLKLIETFDVSSDKLRIDERLTKMS